MDYLRTNLTHFIDQEVVTQADLAKAAGITQPNISRYLNGTARELKAGSVLGIARRLGVSLDDLMTHDFRAGAPSAKKSQAEFDLEALKSALVSFDKTLKALKVPYDNMQDMARTLRFAYDYLSERPEMTKREREAFDLALIEKMRGDIADAAAARDGSRTQAGNRGRTKGAAAQP